MSNKFICTKCKNKSLVITMSMDLGADDYSDERTLQTIECMNCDFQGVALYEESRRGRNESWHHIGYIVTLSTFEVIQYSIKSRFKEIDISKYLNDNPNCFPLKLEP